MYLKNVFQSTQSPLKILSSASLKNAFCISSYKSLIKTLEKKHCNQNGSILNTSFFDSESHILLSEFECDQCFIGLLEISSRKNFFSSLPWVDLGWMLGVHQAFYHSCSSAGWDEGKRGSRQRKGDINLQLLLWAKQY